MDDVTFSNNGPMARHVYTSVARFRPVLLNYKHRKYSRPAGAKCGMCECVELRGACSVKRCRDGQVCVVDNEGLASCLCPYCLSQLDPVSASARPVVVPRRHAECMVRQTSTLVEMSMTTGIPFPWDFHGYFFVPKFLLVDSLQNRVTVMVDWSDKKLIFRL